MTLMGGANMTDFNADDVRAAIAAIDRQFMEDANRGDAAAGAAAYTDDAIVMPPNHPPLEGKQAIEQYLAKMAPQFHDSSFQLAILEVDIQGDTTIVRGTYSADITMPGVDSPMTDQGKTLQVWKKQADGSWKIHRDTWNSNIPIASSLQVGKEEE